MSTKLGRKGTSFKWVNMRSRSTIAWLLMLSLVWPMVMPAMSLAKQPQDGTPSISKADKNNPGSNNPTKNTPGNSDPGNKPEKAKKCANKECAKNKNKTVCKDEKCDMKKCDHTGPCEKQPAADSEPGNNNPGNNNPGNNNPGNNNPGNNDSGNNDSGNNNPGNNNPGNNDSGNNNPGKPVYGPPVPNSADFGSPDVGSSDESVIVPEGSKSSDQLIDPLVAPLVLLAASDLVSTSGAQTQGSGAVWTDNASGSYQDKNEYEFGESVYLSAHHLVPNSIVAYQIITVGRGQNNREIVKSGLITATPLGDWGFESVLVLTPAEYFISPDSYVPGNHNEFQFSADYLDGDNIGGDNFYIGGAPKPLEIEKTDVQDPVILEEGKSSVNIEYDVKVTNPNTKALEDVVVTDLLPSTPNGGLTFVSASDGGTAAGKLITWPTISSLAAGASKTFHVVASASAGGTYNNVSTAKSKDTAPVTDDEDTTVIEITKEDKGDVAFGQNIDYKITVNNPGSYPANGAVITDTLPAGLTYVAGSSNEPISVSGNDLKWGPFDIPAGGTLVITFQAKPDSPGTFINEGCLEIAGLTGCATEETVVGDPDPLLIEKTDVQDPVILEEGKASVDIEYDVKITNPNAAPLTNVVVADLLPSSPNGGLTFVSASDGGTAAGKLITWPTIPSLAGGASKTFHVVASASAAGTFNNKATAGSDHTPPVTDDEDTTVVELTKEDKKDPVTLGDNIDYVITINNPGSNDVNGVVITDTLPAGLTYVSSDKPLDPTSSGNNLKWLPLNIAAGGTLVINVVATPSEAGEYENNACADIVEVASGCATEKTVVEELLVYDVSITKVDSVDPVEFGENTVYTIKVKNTGETTLTQVELTDNMPAGFGYVTSSITPDDVKPMWKLGTLAPGEERVIKITAEAKKYGIHTNVAEVNAKELDEPKQATEPTEVPQVKADKWDIEITKSDDVDPAMVGDTVNYTVTVMNTGNQTLHNLAFNDYLPSGLSYENADVSLSQIGDGLLAWSINKLDPGKSRTYNIATKALKAGQWTNTVSVTADEASANTDEQTRVNLVVALAEEEDTPESLPATGFPTTIWWLVALLALGAGAIWEVMNKRKNTHQ